MLGPFSFEPCSNIVRPNQFVARAIWDSLLSLCSSLCIVPPIFSLYARKLNARNITSPIALLGEVGFPVIKYFVGHGTFKGVITAVLLPRINKKMHRIMYEDSDEEDVTLQEFKILTTTTKNPDSR